MRIGTGIVAVVVGAVCIALWIMSCSGPKAVVGQVRLEPPREANGPYPVHAEVENRGFGHGQVNVIFRLRDQATGVTIEETEKVSLEPGERSLVIAQIEAPSGSYAPDVEVEYPPR